MTEQPGGRWGAQPGPTSDAPGGFPTAPGGPSQGGFPGAGFLPASGAAWPGPPVGGFPGPGYPPRVAPPRDPHLGWRIATIVTSAVSFLPALLLLTNGASVLAVIAELFRNTAASAFIPGLQTGGWCFVAAAVISAGAAIAEIVGAVRRSPFTLYSAIIGLAGGAVGLAGGFWFTRTMNQMIQLVESSNTGDSVRNARGILVFLWVLLALVFVAHLPALTYGWQRRRAQRQAERAADAALGYGTSVPDDPRHGDGFLGGGVEAQVGAPENAGAGWSSDGAGPLRSAPGYGGAPTQAAGHHVPLGEQPYGALTGETSLSDETPSDGTPRPGERP